MSEEDDSERNRLGEQLRRYYELLKLTTDAHAIGALRKLIAEIETRLGELDARQTPSLPGSSPPGATPTAMDCPAKPGDDVPDGSS
jgi:uncharacterized membrane protein YccC